MRFFLLIIKIQAGGYFPLELEVNFIRRIAWVY